ncbi:MAG: hypothetical protein OK455_05830 [Thaumarchaeota archaeon]|nr:hypothetical protein [Nitrososphaerota archaeon]
MVVKMNAIHPRPIFEDAGLGQDEVVELTIGVTDLNAELYDLRSEIFDFGAVLLLLMRAGDGSFTERWRMSIPC